MSITGLLLRMQSCQQIRLWLLHVFLCVVKVEEGLIWYF